MFAHVKNECNSSHRCLHPSLSGSYFPPACACIPILRGGGIKGGLEVHFTSRFALSFYMNLHVKQSCKETIVPLIRGI